MSWLSSLVSLVQSSCFDDDDDDDDDDVQFHQNTLTRLQFQNFSGGPRPPWK